MKKNHGRPRIKLGELCLPVSFRLQITFADIGSCRRLEEHETDRTQPEDTA